MEGTNDNQQLSDLEFDILDELYFVTDLETLSGELDFSTENIKNGLKTLLQRNYVKLFYPDPDTEIVFNELDFDQNAEKYYYLATKAGLIAHNSR